MTLRMLFLAVVIVASARFDARAQTLRWEVELPAPPLATSYDDGGNNYFSADGAGGCVQLYQLRANESGTTVGIRLIWITPEKRVLVRDVDLAASWYGIVKVSKKAVTVAAMSNDPQPNGTLHTVHFTRTAKAIQAKHTERTDYALPWSQEPLPRDPSGYFIFRYADGKTFIQRFRQ